MSPWQQNRGRGSYALSYELACRYSSGAWSPWCRLWRTDIGKAAAGRIGAMIAAQGYYQYMAGHTAGLDLNGLPTLPIDYE